METHKTTLRRTKVRINFNSERSTQDIIDNVEFSYMLHVPPDAVTLLTIHEIVQTTVRPKHLHEIEVMKRAERAALNE